MSGTELERELDNGSFEKVDEVFKTIQKLVNTKKNSEITNELKKISPFCKKFTCGLPEAVRDLKGKENRLFRRILATYARAGRTRKGVRDAILCAIKELPDLRVLRSCLSYLSNMDYKKHDESVDDLLSALENEDLLFPYQIASVLESLIHMHPRKPKTIGSRIRKYAFGINLRKSSDWLVLQKGLEALLTFPYEDKYIQTISTRYLGHNHQLVRRAALTLLTRAPKHIVREKLVELIRHPDSGIASLAIYFNRLCFDKSYSKEELNRIRKGNNSDRAMVRRLSVLYAASATDIEDIAKDILMTINAIPETKSEKMKWHNENILSRIGWTRAS